MWIIPKQLHTSDFVPDTEALSLDSTELSEICARSLFVRSKPSAARIWSQKWKRDSWTALLSGRILNPSHGQSFVTAWTSSLGAIPASHSAQPESGSAQKTLGTSGHLSQTEFGFCDPSSASLRMSKDTSALDSEKSLESWNQSVTRRRGEYSLRLKSAHRTRESGSSSWPTIRASEYKDTGPIGSKSHDHMLGKGYLCAVVTQDAWQTPTTNMDMVRSEEGVQKRIAFRASIGRKSIPDGNLGEQMQRVVKDAANWLTPQSGDVTGSTQEAVVMWANGKRPKTSDQRLRTQVAAEQLKYGQAAPANPSTDGSRQGLWPTVTAHTPDMESSGPNGNSGTYLAGAVKAWATPRAGKTTDENPETWAARQAKGDVATMPLTAQVKAWATPIMGDSHLASTPEVAQKRIEEGKVTLSRQNPGKLNPRWVETLQGVCMGWTSPSCPASVIKNWPKFVSGWCALTIEPTNYDSSATESCLPPPSEHSELFGRNSND